MSLNVAFEFIRTHRLAALEIARFQDQLIERITSEMTAHLDGTTAAAASSSSTSTSPQMGAVTVLQHHGGGGAAPSAQYADNGADWTFARAFLYSLTVLTTVGKWIDEFIVVSTYACEQGDKIRMFTLRKGSFGWRTFKI